MTDTTPHMTEAAREAAFSDYIALLKPRVMRLVVFTALAAMLAAPAIGHPIEALAALVCIAVGAGAAGALNMWWDADIDAAMARTAGRPIPAGRVEAGEALSLGLGLALLSVAMLAVFANFFAAGLLAFTIFFYAVVYSMWLKRATPQNIVIGGAAGAFPPVVAWAAVTGEAGLAPWLMFAVVFLWTPPHFWALALFRNADYTRVGVPMLPAVAGPAETRRQIRLYTYALLPAPVLLALTPAGGPLTLATAMIAGLSFYRAGRGVWARDEAAATADDHRAEKRLFGVSIVYLFAVFAALIGDAALRRLTGGMLWPIW